MCLSLVTVFSIVGAFAQEKANSQTVAYAYVGSSVSAQLDWSEGLITGFAVAADGTAQPIPGARIFGGIDGLTAASGFVYGAAQYGQVAITYTPDQEGRLMVTSSVNVVCAIDPHCSPIYGPEIIYFNPDRSERVLNISVGCGSCNTELVPYVLKDDGSLSFLGSLQDNGAKDSGEAEFSPDNQWAYAEGYGGWNKYRREPNGTLTGPFDLTVPKPPAQQGVGLCLPDGFAPSSLGYTAVIWYAESYWCGEYDQSGYMLATYTVDPSGNLDLVPDSGVIPEVQETKIAFDPNGKYLALAGSVGLDYEQAAVQVYRLQPGGKLASVGGPVIVPGIFNFTTVAWDSSNHVFAVQHCFPGYTCTRDASQTGLYIFNVSDNGVTLAPGSPHVIENPVEVAVLPVK
ncbi:MAG: hypothetical protein WAM71_16370 [Candidatus Korobacteraceae bacterium]